MRQIDIQNAFVHGVLQEEVYIKQTPGYENTKFPPSYVCQLDKVLYGLKQAPMACHSRLTCKLQELTFMPSKVDTSLFIINKGGTTMYVLIHVDDMIIVSSSAGASNKLVQQLTNDFVVEDLGVLEYFLGVEVKPVQNGILLSQGRYLTYLLSRAKMEQCKVISTPMATGEKLSKSHGTQLSDPEFFIT